MELKRSDLLRHHCLVGGKWVGDVVTGEGVAVYNPATGKLVGEVPNFSGPETQEAIACATAAWQPWRNLTAKQRSVILRRWYNLIIENVDDLAQIMTTEQGKPLSEAKGEIEYAASYVEWFAEEGKRVYGDTIPMGQPGKRIVVLKEPVGVCAAITPWNFPAAMITRKVAPALAAGCTVIVKPAAQTPYSALALGVLAMEAGIPAGVLNILTGEAAKIGAALTKSPLVRKLSFTGSTGIGKRLMQDCAANIKKISLELGGHAPFIVFDDCDLDEAVEGALASKYRNSGQTCVCANRFLVQEGVYDAFAERLVAAVKKSFRIGDGFTPGVNQGPLIDENAICKVEEHVADSLSLGARLGCGGQRSEAGKLFFEPTVLIDVTSEMLISREETFGPVAPIFRFKTEEDAIRLANDSPYGLASYFYSRDIGRVWRMAEALEYGMVGINTGIMSTESAPFGGVKESGLGREGSRYGLDEYLELKYLCLGGIS